MKSLFKRFHKRKGFTLVECIIAIAVFAAFCLMVMMIVAGAQKESKLAYDTEKELNGLVENVMGDDVHRGFSSTYSTKSIDFNLSGDNISGTKTFNITYDVVDGHKNYVSCGGCGYFGNNTEFMGGVNPPDFTPWTTNYVCPKCGKTLAGSDIELTCSDCGRSAYYTGCDKEYNSSKAWTYQPGSGSFVCNHCGSAKVSYSNLDSEIFDSSYVKVSGLAANAIRYSAAIPPEKAAVVSVTDGTGASNDSSKATVGVKFNGDVNNPYDVGEYTVSISGVSVPAGGSTKVSVTIPNGYYVEGLKAGGSTDYATYGVTLSQPDYENDTKGSISWTGTTGGVTLTFKLRNYKTGFSFDYDYQNATYEDKSGTKKKASGLAQYWFGLTGNGGATQWPIP